MSLVLSPEELVELTQKTRFKAQAKVLAALGVPFQVRPNGSLVVYLEVAKVLGGVTQHPTPQPAPQLRLLPSRKIRQK
jgi:hypothetical protein